MVLEEEDRVPNKVLLHAGLDLMRQVGKPLTQTASNGRSMFYALPNGETVRVRTCNDHLLVVLAEDANAKMNIEGTDHVLIVMPRKARTAGPVDAYFVPTAVVAEAARPPERKAERLAAGSDDRTWNIVFTEKKSSKGSAYAGFGKKWARYRLDGDASAGAAANAPPSPTPPPAGLKLGDIIVTAKRQIAEAAGVAPEAVRITIDA